MSEIAARVKAIIVDKLGVEESEVTNEASFTNDLGATKESVELIRKAKSEGVDITCETGPEPSRGTSSSWLHRESRHTECSDSQNPSRPDATRPTGACCGIGKSAAVLPVEAQHNH